MITAAIYVLGGLGAFFGLLLAVSSKVFHVETDAREEKIIACLNGANCGGCGYAGCGAYASAILQGAPINLCAAISQDKVSEIASIMGVESVAVERKVAFVHCSGGDKAHIKYQYDGVQDCRLAAQAIGGGPRACSFGCLGYGSCVKVCKFDAIHIVDGVAKVDREACKGCMSCVAVCPKHLISAIPYSAEGVVACSNKDKGGITRKVCESGCLGCRICEKACPYNAIHVVDNVSEKDYSKCQSCGICAEKCPRKLIYFPHPDLSKRPIKQQESVQ